MSAPSLTPEQRARVRQLWAEGASGMTSLAAQFGTSVSSIRRAVAGLKRGTRPPQAWGKGYGNNYGQGPARMAERDPR